MRLAQAAAFGLVVASLAAAPAAQAQRGRGGMLIGPWLGLNFASFSLSNVPASATSRTGLRIGGELQRTLSPELFLRLGAFYSMRGSDGTSQGSSFTIKLNYIEVPVLLGYRFAIQGSQIEPYVMAGGQFALKTGCTYEAPGQTLDCDTAISQQNFGTGVSSFDVGLNFGGGVAIPAGRGRIMVDLRYLVGLVNALKAPQGNASIKNVGFTLGAGYMIPFGD
jgi:hypothetical protein